MDEIYRAARQVVAVLNRPGCVNSAQVRAYEELEAGVCFLHWQSYYSSPGEISRYSSIVRKLKAELVRDSWYQRAWTYHESIVAAAPLHILLPCETDIKHPAWMGTMACQVVLDQWLLLKKSYLPNIMPEASLWRTCPDYKRPGLTRGRADTFGEPARVSGCV